MTMNSYKETKGVSLYSLIIVFIVMSIIVILALAKVYLSNQIYKESRKINSLSTDVAALKEEHSILQLHVQRLKYKIKITDTLFSIEQSGDSTLLDDEKVIP